MRQTEIELKPCVIPHNYDNNGRVFNLFPKRAFFKMMVTLVPLFLILYVMPVPFLYKVFFGILLGGGISGVFMLEIDELLYTTLLYEKDKKAVFSVPEEEPFQGQKVFEKEQSESEKRSKKKKERKLTIGEMLGIEDIRNEIIETKDDYIGLYEILPNNLRTKSAIENEIIFNHYDELQKSLQVSFHVFSLAKRANMEKHVEIMADNKKQEANENVVQLIEHYIDHVKNRAYEKGTDKRLYIWISYREVFTQSKKENCRWEDVVQFFREKESAMISGFRECGNDLFQPKTGEGTLATVRVLFNLLNRSVAETQTIREMPLGGVKRKAMEVELKKERSKWKFWQKEKQNEIISLDDSEELAANEFASSLPTCMDLITPTTIDSEKSPSYLHIDGCYICCLHCFDYPEKPGNMLFDEIINMEPGIDVCMDFQLLDKVVYNKKITQYMGFTLDKSKQGDNQTDTEIHNKALRASKYLKEGLANEEDLWYLNVTIRISADSEQELKRKLRRVQVKLDGKSVLYKRADNMQLDTFLATLPLNVKTKRVELYQKKMRRNMLSSDLARLYPFSASGQADPFGIYLGEDSYDGAPLIIDNFDTTKYENPHFVLIAKSGMGKSFLIQMIANRFRMKHYDVMMICPIKGHEYKRLCDKVGGNYFKFIPGSADTVNLFEIRPTRSPDGKTVSWLASKLQSIQTALSLLMPEIPLKTLRKVEKYIIEMYKEHGIDMENDSIYLPSDERYLNLRPSIKRMPTFQALYEKIKDIKELEEFTEALMPIINGSLSFLNGQTNVDMDNPYIVADISDIAETYQPFAMHVINDIFKDRIKADIVKRKLLIIDELSVLSKGNPEAGKQVVRDFKTLRGFGACVLTAMQELEDAEMREEGFARGIINNAKFKIVLGVDKVEAMALKEPLDLSNEEMIRITKFTRGKGLLCVGSNHQYIDLKAFPEEYDLITTDPNDLRRMKENAG